MGKIPVRNITRAIIKDNGFVHNYFQFFQRLGIPTSDFFQLRTRLNTEAINLFEFIYRLLTIWVSSHGSMSTVRSLYDASLEEEMGSLADILQSDFDLNDVISNEEFRTENPTDLDNPQSLQLSSTNRASTSTIRSQSLNQTTLQPQPTLIEYDTETLLAYKCALDNMEAVPEVGKDATYLLSHLVYLDPPGVQTELFSSLILDSDLNWENEEFSKAIELLVQFSLADIDRNKIIVCPLLRKEVQLRNIRKGKRQQALARLAKSIAPLTQGRYVKMEFVNHALSVWGNLFDKAFPMAKYIDMLLPLLSRMSEVAVLRFIEGRIFYLEEKYVEARVLFEEAYKSQIAIDTKDYNGLIFGEHYFLVLIKLGNFKVALEVSGKIIESFGHMFSNSVEEMWERNVIRLRQVLDTAATGLQEEFEVDQTNFRKFVLKFDPDDIVIDFCDKDEVKVTLETILNLRRG